MRKATGFSLLRDPMNNKGMAYTLKERREYGLIAVAEQITDRDFADGLIYPAVRYIRDVSLNVAVRIAGLISQGGLAKVRKPKNIRAFIGKKMYQPT